MHGCQPGVANKGMGTGGGGSPLSTTPTSSRGSQGHDVNMDKEARAEALAKWSLGRLARALALVWSRVDHVCQTMH